MKAKDNPQEAVVEAATKFLPPEQAELLKKAREAAGPTYGAQTDAENHDPGGGNCENDKSCGT